MNDQKRSEVTIPQALVPRFEALVAEYAAKHGESPEACRRGVEIAVIQAGLQQLRTKLANGDTQLVQKESA